MDLPAIISYSCSSGLKHFGTPSQHCQQPNEPRALGAAAAAPCKACTNCSIATALAVSVSVSVSLPDKMPVLRSINDNVRSNQQRRLSGHA